MGLSRIGAAGLGVALAGLAAGGCASEHVAGFTGRVVDSFGHPIPKASVFIASGDGRRRYAGTASDGDGHFDLAVCCVKEPEIRLELAADGFQAWWNPYDPGNIEGIVVPMARKIDRRFLDRLLAEQDAAARQEEMSDLLAADWDDTQRVLYPYLGRLRADLRQAVAAAEPGLQIRPEHRDGQRQELRDYARTLLLFWGDPGDRDLTAALSADGKLLDESPPPVAGATPREVCEAWTELHFQAEHAAKPWTWHRCDPPIVDPAGSRALIRFEVRYAHWEYDILLFLQHDDQGWRLRALKQDRIT